MAPETVPAATWNCPLPSHISLSRLTLVFCISQEHTQWLHSIPRKCLLLARLPFCRQATEELFSRLLLFTAAGVFIAVSQGNFLCHLLLFTLGWKECISKVPGCKVLSSSLIYGLRYISARFHKGVPSDCHFHTFFHRPLKQHVTLRQGYNRLQSTATPGSHLDRETVIHGEWTVLGFLRYIWIWHIVSSSPANRYLQGLISHLWTVVLIWNSFCRASPFQQASSFFLYKRLLDLCLNIGLHRRTWRGS